MRSDAARVLAVVVVLWVAAVLAVVAVALAGSGGNRVHRRIEACHARGPRYHYWQDRSRCVDYGDYGE